MFQLTDQFFRFSEHDGSGGHVTITKIVETTKKRSTFIFVEKFGTISARFVAKYHVCTFFTAIIRIRKFVLEFQQNFVPYHTQHSHQADRKDKNDSSLLCVRVK